MRNRTKAKNEKIQTNSRQASRDQCQILEYWEQCWAWLVTSMPWLNICLFFKFWGNKKANFRLNKYYCCSLQILWILPCLSCGHTGSHSVWNNYWCVWENFLWRWWLPHCNRLVLHEIRSRLLCFQGKWLFLIWYNF